MYNMTPDYTNYPVAMPEQTCPGPMPEPYEMRSMLMEMHCSMMHMEQMCMEMHRMMMEMRHHMMEMEKHKHK